MLSVAVQLLAWLPPTQHMAARLPTARTQRIEMAVSSRISGLTFEACDAKSLAEVSSFFVDAFWLASTTFDGIQLTASDKRQLEQKVAEDLGPRYGMSKDKTPSMMGGRKGFPSKSLFDTRLIVARDPSGRSWVVRASKRLSTRQAKAMCSGAIRQTGLCAMSWTLWKRRSEEGVEVYIESGIGALAKGIIEKQFNEELRNPYIDIWKPCGVLANLAVAPAYRRSGLGRALCDACERCIVDEWKMDEIALQVEEANTAAITLYKKDGYRDVFRAEDATALRLQPAEPNVFSSLPGPFSALAPENEELLKEVTSPTVTMAKPL